MQSGEVIGVIINAAGKYKWILKFIELDNPDVGALPLIELTWN